MEEGGKRKKKSLTVMVVGCPTIMTVVTNRHDGQLTVVVDDQQ